MQDHLTKMKKLTIYEVVNDPPPPDCTHKVKYKALPSIHKTFMSQV